MICNNSGRLLKGGDPDLETMAKMILHDWQRGKIMYFMQPPPRDS
jgi:nuclear GTP-binding protein